MRTVSDAFREAFQSSETDEVILVLLTITHADLAQPLRLVLNTEEIVSRTFTFSPFPFTVELPESTPDKPGQITLTIDNVDRAIATALRDIEEPPELVLELVMASSPDTLEYATPPMIWRQTTWNEKFLRGVIEGPALFNRRVPHHRYTPVTAPGLFRSI